MFKHPYENQPKAGLFLCFYGSIVLAHGLTDQLHAQLVPQHAAVQGEVVVGGNAPLTVGVEAVVVARQDADRSGEE